MILTDRHKRRYVLKTIGKIFDWTDSLVFSLLIIILIFTFFFSIVGVKGVSMQQTLSDGDRLIVSGFCYTPKNGDIVIISRNYDNLESNDENNNFAVPIVKRVIATEGQRVEIKDGSVYIDKEKLEEDYVISKTDLNQFPGVAVVPTGHIFVLGDNRENSKDSRSDEIGMVDVRYVIGKVLFRIYPFTQIRFF